MGTWLCKGKVDIQHTSYVFFWTNFINRTVTFSEHMNKEHHEMLYDETYFIRILFVFAKTLIEFPYKFI